MKPKKPTSRRNFIKTFFSALLGSIAFTNSGAISARQKTLTENQGQSSKGYRETEHVRNYYRKARF